MSETVADLVKRWFMDAGDDIPFDRIHEEIEYLCRRLYVEYTPTSGPHPRFEQRLATWLRGVPDDKTKRLLFEMVPHISFFSKEQYHSLYRSAYQNEIAAWVIDESDISLDDSDALQRLNTALDETWFCPLTDSMVISDFYHVNNIAGVQYRPPWDSLQELGHREKIVEHIRQKKFKRVVLLEDFVGSGSQIKRALDFAVNLSLSESFLIVPLIVCPEGTRYYGDEYDFPSSFEFRPVLSLPPNTFVAEAAVEHEPPLFASVREATKALYYLVNGGAERDDSSKPYGPFGWKKTGAMVVMYSNTPDNTLPIIHWPSSTWPSPIFPRATRI